MTTLYELAAQYHDDLVRLEQMELDEQTIQDTLEGMTGDLDEKVTNIAKFIRNLESSADAIKDAEAKMAARRKTINKKADHLKGYVLHHMLELGIKEISCPYFTVKPAKNPPALDVFDAKQVPDKFWITPPPPPPPAPAMDKDAIKASIKAGNEVPGARMTQGQRLKIA